MHVRVQSVNSKEGVNMSRNLISHNLPLSSTPENAAVGNNLWLPKAPVTRDGNRQCLLFSNPESI